MCHDAVLHTSTRCGPGPSGNLRLVPHLRTGVGARGRPSRTSVGDVHCEGLSFALPSVARLEPPPCARLSPHSASAIASLSLWPRSTKILRPMGQCYPSTGRVLTLTLLHSSRPCAPQRSCVSSVLLSRKGTSSSSTVAGSFDVGPELTEAAVIIGALEQVVCEKGITRRNVCTAGSWWERCWGGWV